MPPASFTTEKHSPPPSLWWFIGMVAVILAAFILRLYGIAARALWFDEAIEYWMAAVPFSQVHQAVAQATHDPPFYSYFLHIWESIGIQEFWLRMPSLYFSLIGIAGMIRLGKMKFNHQTAVIAGSLLAVGAADIRYAQEVGQYSLMVCLLVFNLLFLYQTTTDHSWRPWLLWGTTALVSTYTHYGSTIVILTTSGTFLIYYLFQRNWAGIKKQIITGVSVVILVLPLILIIIPQQLGRLGATSLPFNLTQFLRISSQIITFQWMGNQLVHGWPWPNIPMWIGWLPVVIAIVFALARSKSIIAAPVLLVISWLGYYLISRTGAYFFLGSRHSLLIAPLLILTAAAGITIIGRFQKLIAAILLGTIFLICFVVPRESQEDLRSVTQYWLTHRQTQEVTYIYYSAAPGFQYQRDLNNGSISLLPRQWYGNCWRGEQTSFCTADNIFYGIWSRHLPPVERKESVIQTIGYTPERFWILFSHTAPGEREELLDELNVDFEIVTEELYEGASILLFEKR